MCTPQVKAIKTSASMAQIVAVAEGIGYARAAGRGRAAAAAG